LVISVDLYVGLVTMPPDMSIPPILQNTRTRYPHLHNRSPKPNMLVPPEKYAELVCLIMMHPDKNTPFLFSIHHFFISILLLQTLEKDVRFGQSATYRLGYVRGNHTTSIKRTSWSNRRLPIPHLSHLASYSLR
jgi:hypothetical protein